MIKNLLSDLEQKSFSVRDDFVPAELCEGLLQEFLKSEFRPAAVGKHNTSVQDQIRTDWIHWIDYENAGPFVLKYLELMDELRQKLNETFFMGLQEFECHFARYEPGQFYQTHYDVKKNEVSSRRVSAVLYLNPDWRASDGGLLRLYDPKKPKDILQGVLPIMGRLALFLSNEIPHEVTVANKTRRSVTGWFHVQRIKNS